LKVEISERLEMIQARFAAIPAQKERQTDVGQTVEKQLAHPLTR
jgi:hypothetical protein